MRSPTYTCDLGTLSGTKCLITSTETRSPTYTCGLGTLSGTKCLITSTEMRSPTYTCGLGTLSGTKCLITKTRTYVADTTCATGTWDGTDCAHNHPTAAPTITGLDASGASVAGTDYSDDFIVLPAGTAVSVAGQGCTLSGEAGSYTLTASRADAGTRTCTTTAGTATATTTATTTVTFSAARTHFHAPAQPPGLRCATVSSTSVVWRWDQAERAEGYEVSIHDHGIGTDPSWKAVGDQNQRSYTTSGWTPSAVPAANRRSLDVRAVNDRGEGQVAYGSCHSLPAGWLTAACDATGEITATWSVPHDLRATPGVAYTATITARLPHGYGATALASHNGTGTTFTRTGSPGITYAVAVRTQPVAGKPVYTETKTAECEITVPVRVEVECRADAKVYTSWAGPADAKQYRLTIGISGTSTTARTVTEYVPDTAQDDPPTSHVRPGAVGARYNITVAANDGAAWTSESEPAATTCDPIAPPAPTGVTASCTSGTLTVAWDTAGEGLSAATAYKPRIFTGTSTTPDPRWAANTTTTSATIPAQGEDNLPTTGVFQVKVKAANTAGDSDWSDPAGATCGPPGHVSGVECTVLSDDSITIEWNPVVGADGYQAVASIWDVASPLNAHLLGWEDAGTPRKTPSGKFVYELDGLDSEVDYYLGVRARNSSGLGDLGSGSVRQCETIDDDWLEVECSAANAMVHIKWDSPPDDGQYYQLTVSQGLSLASWRTKSFPSSTTSWVLVGVPEQTYRVEIESKGVPEYSQTKDEKCPKLEPHGRFPTPNLWPREKGIDWPWEHDLDDEYSNFGHPLPFLVNGVSGYQRACTLADKTWTCKEHWTEPMKVEIEDAWKDVLIANSIEIVEADGLTDTERNWLARGINWSVGRIAKAISWTKDKAVRLFVGQTAGRATGELNVGGYFLEMGNDDRMFAYIFGPTCLPSSINKWKPETFTMPDIVADDYISKVGDYTIKREYTVHYCKETASS